MSAPVRANLPDWHEVSAAFRGQAGETPGDHLVTRWAGSLARLHRHRMVIPARTPDIDVRRGRVVALVDQWIGTHIPARADATQRSVSLGGVLDELAAAYIHAESLLTPASPAPETDVHAAWSRVGFLATRWTDLVSVVVDGQCPIRKTCGRIEVIPAQHN